MEAINLDLVSLFKQQFGTEAEVFNPTFSPAKGNTPANQVTTSATGAAYYGKDLVTGRDYFMPVVITYPADTNTTDPLAAFTAPPGLLQNYELQYCLISISAQKIIVETPLTERRGTVKELIQIKDYEITLKGFVIEPTNDFPEKDVTAMRDIFEVGQSVAIKSAFTDIFLLRKDRSGSDKVVITHLEFPEQKGIKNVRPFVMKLVSDEPFNLVDIS